MPSATEKYFIAVDNFVIVEMPLVTNEELTSNSIGVMQSGLAKTYVQVVSSNRDVNEGKFCETNSAEIVNYPYYWLPSPQDVLDKVFGSECRLICKKRKWLAPLVTQSWQNLDYHKSLNF